MPWQQINGMNSGGSVVVESKSGNTYPARVEYNHLIDEIRSQISNDAHNSLTFWAWLNFDGDDPVVEDFTRTRDGNPPQSPPWN